MFTYYYSVKGVCIVQIYKSSQSNQTNFTSRYKIPVTSANVNSFEKHVVPLYKDLKGDSIKAFYSNKFLHVFTGKEDTALFAKRKPKSFGVMIDTGNCKEANMKYNTTQHASSPFDGVIFAKKFKNVTFEPLKNFQELVTKLLS